MTKATTPLPPPKRIVTDHNADGKSVFLSTGPAPQHHNRQQGLELTMLCQRKSGTTATSLALSTMPYNVGMMLRPNEPVFPNFHTIPIAYHGRSSSVVVGGEPVYRPSGVQRVAHGSNETRFGATRRLDFEVELGAFIGAGNRRGIAIPVDEASEQIVGLCVLNDWSARDIQSWETQPLGPFLG
jgi:fumarylacetoacetase